MSIVQSMFGLFCWGWVGSLFLVLIFFFDDALMLFYKDSVTRPYERFSDGRVFCSKILIS